VVGSIKVRVQEADEPKPEAELTIDATELSRVLAARMI